MDGPKEKFKREATQIFGEDEEGRYTAANILDEHIKPSDAEGLEKITDVLVRNRWLTPQLVRWSCGALVFVGLLIISINALKIHEYRSLWHVPGTMGIGSYGSDAPLWGDAFRHHNHEQKLILFGDTTQSGPARQMWELWQWEPDNPGYYLEYAMAHQEEHGGLPPDFVETAERMDPENGYYRLLAAANRAKHTVLESKTATGKRSGSRRASAASNKKLAQWDIVDPIGHHKSLMLFKQAVAMPEYESHSRKILEQRIALLPQGGDYLTRTIPIFYMAMQRIIVLRVMDLNKVLRAEIQRCGNSKDVAALKDLMNITEQLSRKLSENSVTLIEVLVAKAMMTNLLPYAVEAAKACGDQQLLARYEELLNKLESEKKVRAERRELAKNEESYLKAGWLHEMMMPVTANQVNDLTAVQEIDLAPGRMVDHAFVSRLCSILGWAIFGLIILAVWLESLRGGRVLRGLCGSLRRVLTLSDWLWIFVTGILLPWLYYLLVNEHTSLGAREYSVYIWGYTPALGQLACLWLLLLMVPSFIIRWRLSRRDPSLGVRVSKLAIAGVVIAFIALPHFGIIFYWEPDDDALMLFWLLPALAFILMIVDWLCHVLKRKHRLRTQLLASTVIPIYMIIMMSMALGVLYYHNQEKYWVERDVAMDVSVDEPGFTTIEYRVTEQVKKEFRETMGWTDSK